MQASNSDPSTTQKNRSKHKTLGAPNQGGQHIFVTKLKKKF